MVLKKPLSIAIILAVFCVGVFFHYKKNHDPGDWMKSRHQGEFVFYWPLSSALLGTSPCIEQNLLIEIRGEDSPVTKSLLQACEHIGDYQKSEDLVASFPTRFLENTDPASCSKKYRRAIEALTSCQIAYDSFFGRGPKKETSDQLWRSVDVEAIEWLLSLSEFIPDQRLRKHLKPEAPVVSSLIQRFKDMSSEELLSSTKAIDGAVLDDKLKGIFKRNLALELWARGHYHEETINIIYEAVELNDPFAIRLLIDFHSSPFLPRSSCDLNEYTNLLDTPRKKWTQNEYDEATPERKMRALELGLYSFDQVSAEKLIKQVYAKDMLPLVNYDDSLISQYILPTYVRLLEENNLIYAFALARIYGFGGVSQDATVGLRLIQTFFELQPSIAQGVWGLSVSARNGLSLPLSQSLICILNSGNNDFIKFYSARHTTFEDKVIRNFLKDPPKQISSEVLNLLRQKQLY